jgi:plastocyanin domain-containing protein
MRACHHVAAAWTLVAAASLWAPACKKSAARTAPLADVTAGEHGFTPPSIELPTGGLGSRRAVTFVRTTDKTCATEVVFPDLKIDQKLPLDQVVTIYVPTDAPRTLTFQCGMGMYKGAVVVTAH